MAKPEENSSAWNYISKLKEEEAAELAAFRSHETEPKRRAHLVTRGQWKAVGAYTLFCFSVPFAIYSIPSAFRVFTNFHNRLLNLKSKGPGGLFGWAFVMSIVYSSAAIPLYYKGALRILGLNDLNDLQGVMTDTIISRFETDESKPKLKKLKELDNHFVYKLDEIAGFDKAQTDDYLADTFSRPNKTKRDDSSE